MTRAAIPALFTAVLGAAGAAAQETPGALGPGTIEDLRALEAQVMSTSRKAMEALVFIDGGSGFFTSEDGLILTNNHVIADGVRGQARRGKDRGTARFTVGLLGGRRIRAEVVGRDPDGDIALLKATDPGPYPRLELGDSDTLRPGQWVLAMGNPFLLGESPFPVFVGPGDFTPSISLGVVSALHRKSELYPDAIQIDVAVNPGSSGGPLLTTDGKVMGITGKIQTRFLVEVNSGVGYAVPSNQIRRFLTPLAQAGGGLVKRGSVVGLQLAERALVVSRVITGSPGERAGLRAGDRIVAVDGLPVWNRRRWEGVLATYPAGARIRIRVERTDGTADVEAVLDPDLPGWLGLFAEPAGDARKGVVIKEAVEGGPAARAGLKAGDLIVRMNDIALEDVSDLRVAMEERRAGDQVVLVVRRGGREVEHTVRLDGRPDE